MARQRGEGDSLLHLRDQAFGGAADVGFLFRLVDGEENLRNQILGRALAAAELLEEIVDLVLTHIALLANAPADHFGPHDVGRNLL